MTYQLTAKIRERRGKSINSLRLLGQIPAVVYGSDTKNQLLTVNYHQFQKFYQQVGRSKIFDLILPQQKQLKAVVHDLQIDPLTDKIIHIDFFQINLKKKITASIPLVYIGESPAVKELGGILVKNITEIEIEALPNDLIHEIKVDLQPLKKFNDKILISDLPKPARVKIIRQPNEVVALINQPRSEEELKALETQVSEEEAIEAVTKVETKKEETEETQEEITETKKTGKIEEKSEQKQKNE